MTTRFTYQLFNHKQRLKFVLPILVSILIIINISVDFFTAKYQNYSFYFSESLLFSSYWALFLPYVQALLQFIKRIDGYLRHLMLLIGTVILHLATYPFLVWLFSKIYYYHTFDYGQTLKFGLSAYFVKTIIIYGFIVLIYSILKTKKNFASPTFEKPSQVQQPSYITTLFVADHSKKVMIKVCDIFYFSANSPYVDIFHTEKKYLHSDTLKSLETQLNNKLFVRIHKSHIVNISKIRAIQSRKNGDYDITLSNNTSLRVSRNYAKTLKENLAPLLTLK